MTRSPVPWRPLGALLALAVLAAGCGETPSEIGDLPLDVTAQFDVNPPTGTVWVCKVGPLGTSAGFTISAAQGTLLVPATFTVDASPTYPGNCVVAWEASGERFERTTVTVGELVDPAFNLTKIDVYDYFGWATYYPPLTEVSLEAHYFNASVIKFYNEAAAQGCTPGFWRQDQHFDRWPLPYTPDTPFSDVFADAFPGMTLLEVVWLGKGDLNALGRHSVAALLDAASPGVDYPLTVAEVIAAFDAAYASGDYEEQKDVFEGYNEGWCPLD